MPAEVKRRTPVLNTSLQPQGLSHMSAVHSRRCLCAMYSLGTLGCSLSTVVRTTEMRNTKQHIPDFSISKYRWASYSAGCLFASAAHRHLVCIWCVVLIFCHRSLGNIEVSIYDCIQRSWFSEWLEKVSAALSRSAGLWGDLVERCRSPKELGKMNAYTKHKSK